MKIHLIANMYPNSVAPSYGIFVKNTEDILVQEGYIVDKTVLYKETNRYFKLIKYFIYYFTILWKGIIHKYDITYVHYASHNALPLLLLKKIRNSTVIYTNVHGSDVVPEVPSQEKYQKYVKDLLQKSNKVITPSNYYRGLVIEKYRVKEEKVFVFPSGGVNKDVFYQMSTNHQALEELGAASGTHYIGFVGRLDVGKGWDIFLKAIAELKSKNQFENKKAIIVGSGKDSDSFERLLKELKLEDDVIAFPLLPQEKLRLIYNSIDVFCFPTTRKGESLGLVGLEAMACGTPVIGSKIGGLLDYIIDGHNGFLFNVGDYIDLSNKILAYYKLNEVERNQMSKNALSKANEYEVENIKGTLITIFNKDYKKVQNYS